jgi:hypothetical protein
MSLRLGVFPTLPLGARAATTTVRSTRSAFTSHAGDFAPLVYDRVPLDYNPLRAEALAETPHV